MNLNDEVRGGTACFDYAGLAEGTNDHTVKIAGTAPAGVNYAIDGIMHYKANTDNIDPTACDAQADDTTCLYLFTLTATGTLDTIKGDEVLTADLTAGNAVLRWPVPADSTCPIGAMKIATDGATFTVGVDDITDDISGGTVTFYNLFSVPSAPMTS
jgi:hypothetical protein